MVDFKAGQINDKAAEMVEEEEDDEEETETENDEKVLPAIKQVFSKKGKRDKKMFEEAKKKNKEMTGRFFKL